jgi:hypothetical protein
MQELHCLELLTDSHEFIARTTLDPKIPMVYGSGKDFSLVFGIVFQSVLDSMKKFKSKELAIYTRSLENNVFVDIRINGSISFEENMFKTINPSIHPEDRFTVEQTQKEFSLCHTFVELFGMKMDVNHQDNDKSIIRITIPTEESDVNTEKESSLNSTQLLQV